MEHPSFRTLAATFLVVATATGSFSFFFSSSFSAHSSAPPQDVQTTVPVNAIGTEAIPPATLSSEPFTLTEAFSDAVIKEITAIDLHKVSLFLKEKDANKLSKEQILQQLNLAQTNSTDILTPDRVSEIKQELQLLRRKAEKIASQAIIDPSADTSGYLERLEGFFNKYTRAIKNLTDIAANKEEAGTLSIATNLMLEKMLQEVLELHAPELFSSFHKQFVLLIAQIKQLSTLVNSTDPLKSLLVFNVQKKELQNLSHQLSQELHSALNPSSLLKQKHEESHFIAFIKGFMTIPTAHAFLGLGDIVFDPGNIAQMILDVIGEELLESAKSKIINGIARQTLAWVRGGKKPKFVTDWKGFLKKAAKSAAGEVVAESAPFLCNSFGPLLTIAATPLPNVPPEEGVECTLDDVVSNVKDFYRSFETGGWVAYGEMLKPQNNIFGALVTMKEKVGLRASQKQEAEKSDAESGNGFRPTRVCVSSHRAYIGKGDDPKVDYGEDYIEGTLDCKTSEVPNTCAVKLCDEWKNTTPAKFVVEALSQEVAQERIQKTANTVGQNSELIMKTIIDLVKSVAKARLNEIIRKGIL
ncbi:hypothetical protein D6779_06065 [Candidatus Parcubacteria bacterium]|nr:MAG: hypothetical protein D6779_06065 [Candidatus Parcubacteria bacterium]